MEEQKCEFDIDGCCYAFVCYCGIQCKAKDKDGNVVRMATVKEIKDRYKKLTHTKQQDNGTRI